MKKLPTAQANVNTSQVLTFVAFGAFLGGALFAGIIAVILQGQQHTSAAKALRESDIRTAGAGYTFIDPLIGIKNVDDSARYADIEQQVASFIADQKKNGLVTATVDFRDINEPGGFVLNPSELYTPASLNKVPVMMAYYKLAESDPSILSEEITYSGIKDSNSVEEIRSTEQLAPGARYTVEQLIERMIRYSDNNAADLLTKHLEDTGNLGTYTAVFSDLGVDPNVLSKYTDNVTAQEYSIFLRSLYNATYLNRDDSEHALQLLSETDFTEGIGSGVPNGVLVAQKFGEVRMTDSAGTLVGKEINICGIVYYPEHPYLLCIMTKESGDDIQALENDIASISRIVYKGMQGLYP